MAEISFEIKGKKVEPHGMKDALDVMFMEHLYDEISNRLGPLKCKKHGHEPKVIIKGQSLDNLNYEVTGCCNDLIIEAQKKLK